MNGLMKLARVLQGRPSDLVIRAVRFVYGLLLAAIVYAGLYLEYDWSLFGYLSGYGEYLWYAVGLVAVWWLLWAVSPWCLLHRKTLKKIMMGLGGFMMIASIFLVDTPEQAPVAVPTAAVTASGSVAYDALVEAPAAEDADTGVPVRFAFFVLGLVSLGLGATSKFVTSGCLKYKEKITVIRV